MINLKSITIKNFLSVGAVTLAINLDQHGLTLVLGANADTNGNLSRNGAGKTTILQAISFALYGKALSRIKIPNLINNQNNKQMLVTIDFEADGVKYRIERGRKPDVMKFYVNNNEMKEEDVGSQQGENRHTQEEIERVVGMSHTMFKHIVALNTYTEPFLRMPVASQREVIEELLGVTQISQRAAVLSKLMGQTRESMRNEQARLKAIIETNSRIESAISNTTALSQSWSLSHEQIIARLTEEIETLKTIDFEQEILNFAALDEWVSKEREIISSKDALKREGELLRRELNALEADLERLRKDSVIDISAQIKRLETEKSRKEKDCANITSNIATKETELAKLKSDIALSGKLECFSCGQELEGTDHLEVVLAKMQKNVDKIINEISSLVVSIGDINGEISHIDSEIQQITTSTATKKAEAQEKLEAKSVQVATKVAQLTTHDDHAQEYSDRLTAIGPRPETLFHSRDEVYKTKQTFDSFVRDLELEIEKHNPHESQVETFKSTLQEVNYETLNDLDSLHKHQDFLLRLLTNKDSFIRKKIVDQNLNYLNSRMHYYLEKLGLPHEVKFQSDLSVEILLLGRDFDFEQLSRGEMNRVIMATSWSFRDVWESLNSSFNLMFVDEMLDQGTDSQGVEAALGILKSMARERNKNVFLISHRDDLIARIDRILLVKKENGFTSFNEDMVE